jgi:GPH family glycoside/pentoside/hexuronide:cation symporter
MRTQRVLSYGVLALPLSFAALPIYVHVPRFYEQVTGLDLAVLGAILLAARLFDAFTDPWLGWLADRFSRPRMIALALLPFTAGFVALLHPAPDHPALWLLGSLLVTYVGFSAASVAYQAHGAGLSDQPRMRTRLTASREGFGLLGVLLAAALPALLAADLSVGTARLSWVLLALLLPASAWFFLQGQAVAVVASGSGSAVEAPAAPMMQSLQRVLADDAFRRLLTVFLASGIAAALPATLFLFFVADVLQREPASGPLLGLYFLAGALSLPGWVALAGRIGRVRAWLMAMGLSVVAFAGAGLLGAGDTTMFAVICLMSGLALGADLALPAAMAADLGERQQLSGACFGVWNFVTKLNLALAAGLALPLLSLMSYEPGSGEGLPALRFAYAVLPLVFKILAAALLWRWRHDLETQT